MRTVSKIIAALVMGGLAALAASPLAANFVDGGYSQYVFLGVLALTALIVLLAPTGRRAWGRGSLIVGAIFIAMPLFIAGLSAQIGSAMVAEAASGDEAMTAVGATIGGGMMVGASLFLGLLLGAIFLILGVVLVLGGRREVVVVQRSESN